MTDTGNGNKNGREKLKERLEALEKRLAELERQLEEQRKIIRRHEAGF